MMCWNLVHDPCPLQVGFGPPIPSPAPPPPPGPLPIALQDATAAPPGADTVSPPEASRRTHPNQRELLPLLPQPQLQPPPRIDVSRRQLLAAVRDLAQVRVGEAGSQCGCGHVGGGVGGGEGGGW